MGSLDREVKKKWMVNERKQSIKCKTVKATITYTTSSFCFYIFNVLPSQFQQAFGCFPLGWFHTVHTCYHRDNLVIWKITIVVKEREKSTNGTIKWSNDLDCNQNTGNWPWLSSWNTLQTKWLELTIVKADEPYTDGILFPKMCQLIATSIQLVVSFNRFSFLILT